MSFSGIDESGRATRARVATWGDVGFRIAAIAVLVAVGCVSRVIGWTVRLDASPPWKLQGSALVCESEGVRLMLAPWWIPDGWAMVLRIENRGKRVARIRVNEGTHGKRMLIECAAVFLAPSEEVVVDAGEAKDLYMEATALSVGHPPKPGENVRLDVTIDGTSIRGRFAVASVQARTAQAPVFMHR